MSGISYENHRAIKNNGQNVKVFISNQARAMQVNFDKSLLLEHLKSQMKKFSNPELEVAYWKKQEKLAEKGSKKAIAALEERNNLLKRIAELSE